MARGIGMEGLKECVRDARKLMRDIFVIVGFKSKGALIPIIITMAVAVFGAHAGEAFSEREHALLYLFVFIGLYFTGDGDFSIENWKKSLKK